ncbi:PqqD family protein [Thermomonas aquatica]|jgi:hypothetical protein|uniref:PqqD family protein n=1 Tax=Thermomonas aquatica TaxID=2202149 RepID=A0A5B7ZMN2_9GAMM|nr:PqqD family protein [Thermomonas aquatica]QDA55879.1 PqqD family protein [Thermomonas aquatica]
MSNPTYLLREENVAARRIGDELMIMSAKESALFSLNETAAILWNAADGITPLSDIVARDICTRYEMDADTAMRDACELVEGLAAHGIVRLSDRPFGDQGSSP